MIIIINPNSTVSMTEAMLATAQNASPQTQIQAWTSHDGPPAIQGPADHKFCIPPLLKLVAKASEQKAQAIIIGCSDDTGLDEARAIAACPVIGIGQAAYHMAALTGPRFSVVTTLDVSVPILFQNIHDLGFGGHLAKVRASGVPVLALEEDADRAAEKVLAEIARAQDEDDIQSVVLGCAGMSHIARRVSSDISVRLIDGVEAAARLGAFL